MQISDWNLSATHPTVDHDTKHTGPFDAVCSADGWVVKRGVPAAPNMNAYAERWGRRSAPSASTTSWSSVSSICDTSWPSSSLTTMRNDHIKPEATSHSPPPTSPQTVPFPSGEIQCRECLGGRLKHYYRVAA